MTSRIVVQGTQYHPVRAQACYPLISVVAGVNDYKAGNIAGLLAKHHLYPFIQECFSL